ncbi:MAG TPA: homoserine dehydrogenase [Dehalococcoidia bacterium]|nr:homoserine dehydrogenase [Dehalococcoidia bacterium]
MGSDRRAIGIGLMGLGGVGSGVARILHEKADVYARQIGLPLVLRRVLVRDKAKARGFRVDPELLTTDARDLLGDPSIELIIEVMGGEQPAYEYLSDALTADKFVVTANKEVMAKHGAELLSLARQHNVDLLYEASVGGGIPIIAPLKRDLLANDIVSVTAIINGTTNYILTEMSHGGGSFEDALAAAQELGYAEPDPTNDIEGIDAAYKLAILATLAFHVDVRPNDVYREGITSLTPRDFAYAAELGYAIKLLAIGRRTGNGVQARVHPALVPRSELLANVDGVLNAVEIEGDLMDRVLFEGPGAGSLPTTSAVVADALDAAVSISSNVYWPHSVRRESGLRVQPVSEAHGRYYLRIGVADQPGVLARIATALSDRAISIASVIQKEVGVEGTAEIVIMTHDASEAAVQTALDEIRRLDGVHGVEQMLRVKP